MRTPGHGRLGTRDHVRQFREYMQDLYAEVLKHARAGLSLEEMQATIRLPKYEKWFGYQSDNPRLNWFPMNIAGMYRYIQNHRRPNCRLPDDARRRRPRTAPGRLRRALRTR